MKDRTRLLKKVAKIWAGSMLLDAEDVFGNIDGLTEKEVEYIIEQIHRIGGKLTYKPVTTLQEALHIAKQI